MTKSARKPSFRNPFANWRERNHEEGVRAEIGIELAEVHDFDEAMIRVAMPQKRLWPGFDELSKERQRATIELDGLVMNVIINADILANPKSPAEAVARANKVREKLFEAINGRRASVRVSQIMLAVETFATSEHGLQGDALVEEFIAEATSGLHDIDELMSPATLRSNKTLILNAISSWGTRKQWKDVQTLLRACGLDPGTVSTLKSAHSRMKTAERRAAERMDQTEAPPDMTRH
jgi:hypothetical protein